MDLGIELLVNPYKTKKKNYFKNKKEDDFNLPSFILEYIIDELNIDLEKHPKKLIKNIIDITLKISNEDKTIDISYLEELKKKKEKEKEPVVLTKNLKIITKFETKEPTIDVKKLL
jgi:hypothetical protein|tara:strand:- start:864 stop:1211 length:348 start_codon:yes stop_codon:yes gene_type:complete